MLAGSAWRGPALGVLLLWMVAPLLAGVRGTVTNASTGRPEAGVALTLSSFRDGMTPLEETVSGPDGSFSFEKELPPVASGQPFAGAIRADHDGVGYTEILRSGAALEGVRITVHSVAETGLPAPSGRVLIIEPGADEMIVREAYMFENDSSPPVTYSSESGTLRFHLPAAAEGVVDVSGTGPAGMPLRSTGLPAGEPDVYKVDFPLKPGENRIDLTYLLPHADGGALTVRSLYPGVPTRIAVPDGVTLSGDALRSLGVEPSTQASLYSLPDRESVEVAVSGTGSLRAVAAAASGGGSGADISIEPAPIAEELPWIAGLSALILGLGFVHLLLSRRPEGGKG